MVAGMRSRRKRRTINRTRRLTPPLPFVKRPGLCPFVLNVDTAAVYQVNSKDKLQHMALEAIHANFAVMAVSPFRTSLGFAPPEQMVLPFVLGEGASRSKALLNVWVHQLSSDALVPISPPDVINVSISGTDSSSCVLSASLDVLNFAPEDIAEALAKPAKARLLVASLLPRALAEDPLMDIFRLTRISGRWMSALFRVKLSAAEAYLKISGMGAVWVNTPKHLVDDTRLIWMRDPADPSSPMSLDSARNSVADLPRPLGLIAKQNNHVWSYAIRVKVADYKEAQLALAVDTKETFYVQGVPTYVSEADLQVILDQLQWPAKVVAGTRRVWKGRASIAVKAGAPPTISCFTVRVDNEQVQLQVISRKSHARAKTQPPRAVSVDARLVVEAPSWSSALKGKYTKSESLGDGQAAASIQTYAQTVAGPPTPPPFNGDSSAVGAPPQPGYEFNHQPWQPAASTEQPGPWRSRSRTQHHQHGSEQRSETNQDRYEGQERWWRGSKWKSVGSQWQKIDTPTIEVEHDDVVAAAAARFAAEFTPQMEVDEASRKRLTFIDQPDEDGHVRATAKRRVNSNEASMLQARLNETMAMLDVYKGVLTHHGITCPQHASLDEDDDDDLDLGLDGEDPADDLDADMHDQEARSSAWDGTGDAPDMVHDQFVAGMCVPFPLLPFLDMIECMVLDQLVSGVCVPSPMHHPPRTGVMGLLTLCIACVSGSMCAYVVRGAYSVVVQAITHALCSVLIGQAPCTACVLWQMCVSAATVMVGSGDGKHATSDDNSSYYYSSSSNSSNNIDNVDAMSQREEDIADFSNDEHEEAEENDGAKSPVSHVSTISVKSVLHTEDLGRPPDAEAPFLAQVVAP
eukprot:6460535-Amphidinium_carterae.1